MLGKFYLFRPSSLILLLWLVLALAFAMDIVGRQKRVLRAALLIGIGPLFLAVQGDRLLADIDASAAVANHKAALVAAVRRLTDPDAIVLIEPAIEMQWLDFERRTRRATLVMWKFAPTNDAELIVWYRRMQHRQVVFDQGCGGDRGVARPAFVLTTSATASLLSATCGPEAFRIGPWVLLKAR
jgi:hypothetical protein